MIEAFFGLETPEQTPDIEAGVEALLDQTFGTQRRKRGVYRLRQGRPLFGFTLTEPRRGPRPPALWASLRFWTVRLPRGRKALLLGPLAVRRDLQGQGYGRHLVGQSLAYVRAHTETTHVGVLVSGEASYYRQFGFETHTVRGLTGLCPTPPLEAMGWTFPRWASSSEGLNAYPGALESAGPAEPTPE